MNSNVSEPPKTIPTEGIKLRVPLRQKFSAAATKDLDALLSRALGQGVDFTIGRSAISLRLRQIDLEAAQRALVESTPNEVAALKPAHRPGSSKISLSIAVAAAAADVVEAIGAVGSYGVKSGTRIYVGFNSERKVKNRKEKVASRTLHYYAQDSNFHTAENTLPAGAQDKIVCADSEAYLKSLPCNCVDVVFTSPPYNFGLNYGEHMDAAHWSAYFDKLFAVLDECIRVLKFGGRLIINVQPLFSDYIPSHHIISSHLMSRKLIWKGEILWEKNNYNCKYTSWGSWKSASNPYLKYTWEFVEVFCKGSLRKPAQTMPSDISGDEFKKWVFAKWSIAPERAMKRYGHPAMFPEELASRVLKLFSFPGDVVLDPFNGVGTTTFVARRLGRRYIGIDVSEDYCAKAVARLESSMF